jgi:hypothetical protein
LQVSSSPQVFEVLLELSNLLVVSYAPQKSISPIKIFAFLSQVAFSNSLSLFFHFKIVFSLIRVAVPGS